MYTGLSPCKMPYCRCTPVCLHLKCHIVNVRRSVFMQSAILYLYTGLSSCKVPYCKCTQVCLHAKYHIVPVHRSVFIQSAILYPYTGLSSFKVPYCTCTQVCLHAKCPLFLSDCLTTLRFCRQIFEKNINYQILWKCIHWEQSCSVLTDGQIL